MSFIRATSNPEGLYVWHDVGGYIAIMGHGNISLRDWGTLKRLYRADPYGDMHGKRLRVTHDVSVIEKGVEMNTDGWTIARRLKGPRTALKVRISLARPDGTWHTFYLWEVTYRYMMDNATRR